MAGTFPNRMREKKSIFTLRTAEYDPHRISRREREEAERRAEQERLSQYVTALDLNDYLEADPKLKQAHPQSNERDRAKVDKTLLDDILEAGEYEQINALRRLRSLALVNETGGFPLPKITRSSAKALILQQMDQTAKERVAKQRAGDDFENESDAYNNWTRLLSLVLSHESEEEKTRMDEPAVRFLEERLKEAYGWADYHSKQIRGRAQTDEGLNQIKKIREAVYWRHLYPHLKLPETIERSPGSSPRNPKARSKDRRP